MSQPDRITEPHVSPDELRAALAPRRSRPSPVVAAAGRRMEREGEPAASRRVERDSAPAWEWTTELSEGDEAELVELRNTVAAQRERIEALEQAASAARTNERDAREALSALAAAGPFRRVALRRELVGRGLL